MNATEHAWNEMPEGTGFVRAHGKIGDELLTKEDIRVIVRNFGPVVDGENTTA